MGDDSRRAPSPTVRCAAALDGILTVDVLATLLQSSLGAARAARVALPTALPGAPEPTATFADSAGRPVDAFDVAVARALAGPAAMTPALAGAMVLAGPVPPRGGSDLDGERAARFVPAAVPHARPLMSVPRDGPGADDADDAPAVVVAAPATSGLAAGVAGVLAASPDVTLVLVGGGAGLAGLRDAAARGAVAVDASRVADGRAAGAFAASARWQEPWALRGSVRRLALPRGVAGVECERAFMLLPRLEELDLAHCDGVTVVGADFGAACASLRRVALPDGVTVVGDGFCSRATALEQLDLSKCSRLARIGHGFAAGCVALRCLRLPSSVVELGVGFCRRCAALHEIDVSHCTGLTHIPLNFASQATNLRRVLLPASVTAIEPSFCLLSATLTSIDLSHCTALRRVGHGFAGCSASLRAVRLPPSVELVGPSFCYRSTRLTELDLSSCVHLAEVGSEFAAECTALRRVALPASVTAVGRDFCRGAAALAEVDAPACALVAAPGHLRRRAGGAPTDTSPLRVPLAAR